MRSEEGHHKTGVRGGVLCRSLISSLEWNNLRRRLGVCRHLVGPRAIRGNSCIRCPAFPNQSVRTQSAAANPSRAALPSARSEPLQRRARTRRASVVALRCSVLFAQLVKANMVCLPRSARHLASAPGHHASPTRRSSGHPTAGRGLPLSSTLGLVGHDMSFCKCEYTSW